MPRKRKNNQPDINGMSVKMMKRRKPINQDYLIPIEPKTETQQKSLMPMPMESVSILTVLLVQVKHLFLST